MRWLRDSRYKAVPDTSKGWTDITLPFTAKESGTIYLRFRRDTVAGGSAQVSVNGKEVWAGIIGNGGTSPAAQQQTAHISVVKGDVLTIISAPVGADAVACKFMPDKFVKV